MKLIVLYGPANSGKTTSLKKVYEVLKCLNYTETKEFKYLDLTFYLDFLDVLELNPKETQLDIDKCLDNASTYHLPNKYDKTNINTIFSVMRPLLPDGDSINLQKNYRSILDAISLPPTKEKTVRVGIDLEGDFGDNNPFGKPSLCNRLKELQSKNCEIIICACRNTIPLITSLTKFVNGCSGIIDVYIVPTTNTKPISSSLCNAFAARILYVLRHVI